MMETHTYLPFAARRLAPPRGKGAAAVRDTPGNNHILAALPPETYARLLPHLKAVPLLRGWMVYGAGDTETYLYFVTSGIVSQGYVLENGATAGFLLTGSEGVVGIASFLGGGSELSQALVLGAGRAYRIGASALMGEFERCGHLQHLLLRYLNAMVAQIGQVAACNRHHSVEQQLCRFLLTSLDRVPSNELTVTQERIAHILGVRREGVSHAAKEVRKAGLIETHRGSITVLDRHGLAARACECYEVVCQEYGRLLPELLEQRAA